MGHRYLSCFYFSLFQLFYYILFMFSPTLVVVGFFLWM